jgi:hypothetical protein
MLAGSEPESPPRSASPSARPALLSPTAARWARRARAYTTTNASTNSASEVVMSYFNLPANSLGSKGCLELDLQWQVSANNGTWTPAIRIITGSPAGTTGGTALFAAALSAGSNARTSFLICNTATGAQYLHNNSNSFTSTTNSPGTAAIDTTSAFTVSITAKTASASDTITLRSIKPVIWPSTGGN